MLEYIGSNFLDIMTVAGYVLEIFGVAMMANRFLSVDFFSLIFGIYSAIFRSKFSEVVASLAEDDQESVKKTLKGLSLLLWGFSLQFVSFVLEKFVL